VDYRKNKNKNEIIFGIRNMKKTGLNVGLMILLLVFTGCKSTDFLKAKAEVTLISESYPSKEIGTKIDVFITNKPDKEYIEFAMITCKSNNDNWNLEQITKKALEIGADGVIILGKAGSTGLGIPIGNSSYVVSEEYGMTAVAIKYI
jgi:hypothetical protein